MIVLLNKPYGVLCQFTDTGGRPTLADYIAQPAVYPAGRLDFDSEGLVVLTDEPAIVARLSQPRHKTPKRYAVEVEGVPVEHQLERLRRGVVLNDGPTLPAEVRELDAPPAWLWPRDPPVRFRKSVPTRWLELAISEGRNRQVRRMTAAVGLPTLRLIRVQVGPHGLAGLAPGESRVVT